MKKFLLVLALAVPFGVNAMATVRPLTLVMK